MLKFILPIFILFGCQEPQDPNHQYENTSKEEDSSISEDPCEGEKKLALIYLRLFGEGDKKRSIRTEALRRNLPELGLYHHVEVIRLEIEHYKAENFKNYISGRIGEIKSKLGEDTKVNIIIQGHSSRSKKERVWIWNLNKGKLRRPLMEVVRDIDQKDVQTVLVSTCRLSDFAQEIDDTCYIEQTPNIFKHIKLVQMSCCLGERYSKSYRYPRALFQMALNESRNPNQSLRMKDLTSYFPWLRRGNEDAIVACKPNGTGKLKVEIVYHPHLGKRIVEVSSSPEGISSVDGEYSAIFPINKKISLSAKMIENHEKYSLVDSFWMCATDYGKDLIKGFDYTDYSVGPTIKYNVPPARSKCVFHVSKSIVRLKTSIKCLDEKGNPGDGSCDSVGHIRIVEGVIPFAKLTHKSQKDISYHYVNAAPLIKYEENPIKQIPPKLAHPGYQFVRFEAGEGAQCDIETSAGSQARINLPRSSHCVAVLQKSTVEESLNKKLTVYGPKEGYFIEVLREDHKEFERIEKCFYGQICPFVTRKGSSFKLHLLRHVDSHDTSKVEGWRIQPESQGLAFLGEKEITIKMDRNKTVGVELSGKVKCSSLPRLTLPFRENDCKEAYRVTRKAGDPPGRIEISACVVHKEVNDLYPEEWRIKDPIWSFKNPNPKWTVEEIQKCINEDEVGHHFKVTKKPTIEWLSKKTIVSIAYNGIKNGSDGDCECEKLSYTRPAVRVEGDAAEQLRNEMGFSGKIKASEFFFSCSLEKNEL